METEKEKMIDNLKKQNKLTFYQPKNFNDPQYELI